MKPSHSSRSRQVAADWSSSDDQSTYTDVYSSNSRANYTRAYQAGGVTTNRSRPSYGRATQRADSVELPREVVHASGPHPGTKQHVVSNTAHFYPPYPATTSMSTSARPASDRRDINANRNPTSDVGHFIAPPPPPATAFRGTLTAAERRDTKSVRRTAPDVSRFYATPTVMTSGSTSTVVADRRDASVHRTPAFHAIHTSASDAVHFYAVPTATASQTALTAAERRDTQGVRTPASDISRFYATPSTTNLGDTPTAAGRRDTNAVLTPASNAYVTPTERRDTKAVRTPAFNTGGYYDVSTATTAGSMAPTGVSLSHSRSSSQLAPPPHSTLQVPSWQPNSMATQRSGTPPTARLLSATVH
jgi:hypothetical protein